MRKLYAAILSAAICLAVSGAPAWASEQQATLSAGYLHARTNAPGSDNLNGINVKYRYEFTDTLGMVTSFSYSSLTSPPLRHSSSPPQRDAPLLPPSVQNDAVPPAGRHPPTWHRENHSASPVENLHTR